MNSSFAVFISDQSRTLGSTHLGSFQNSGFSVQVPGPVQQTDQVSLSKYLHKSVIFCSAPRVKFVKQISVTGSFLAMLYTLGGMRQPSDAMSQSQILTMAWHPHLA